MKKEEDSRRQQDIGIKRIEALPGKNTVRTRGKACNERGGRRQPKQGQNCKSACDFFIRFYLYFSGIDRPFFIFNFFIHMDIVNVIM